MTSDEDLVARAQSGDRRAMDDLLRRHYDRIYAVCRRVTGHDADAADAAQHALIAIVRALPRFDGRAAFSTWAYRIATNASLDELRRRRRRPTPTLDADREDSGPPAVIDPDAHRAIDVTMERDALQAALQTLPDDYRIPVVLRDVGDLDYAEIAEQLDLPIGTVKSRIARGRAALAKAYRASLEPLPGVGNHSPSGQRPTAEP